MKPIYSLMMLLLCVSSCNKKQEPSAFQYGNYRAWLEIQDNEKLPFVFKVLSDHSLEIYNGEEVIEVSEVTFKNDSVYIQTPVFEGIISAQIDTSGNLDGYFKNESLNRVVPFKAIYDETNRFDRASASADVNGVWETVFSEGIEGDEYAAKGIFKQKGSKVTGTFRTTTGDYRFLEGVMKGDTMRVSAFDGAHAFLFVAKVTDSAMNGNFYSGDHWKEPFVAKRNQAYELPSADSLTFLKKGYDRIEFSFPDASGKQVSLSDDRFKGKVVVVQLMGTWCPNCLDESKYYSKYYKANKEKDVEFVALSFEYAKTKEKAFKGINRLITKLDIDYPVLLAQFGSSDKGKANEKLPMLNHVLSYPTSIFIDKEGKVRKIHTGFNGPATGEKYFEFKEEFEGFVERLLVE